MLHLLRRRFIQHGIIDGNRLFFRIVLFKEVKVVGKQVMINYEKENYLYRPDREHLFYFGGVPAIAHRIHSPEPVTLSELGQTLFVQGTTDYSSQEVRAAIESKVVIDFNRSIYQTKDIITFLGIIGLCALMILNIYLTYTMSQQILSLINFFNHYFAANPVT